MKQLCSLLFGALLTISCYASLPKRVFAPYVDVMLTPTFNLMDAFNATGQKYYTLAFITASTDNKPAWGGMLSMNSNHMLDQINQLRAVGGDVIVSFGGANGRPIDAAITDVNALVDAYESVIKQYGLTWIDFDIEGSWISDQASIDRRNKAAKILQERNPELRITYCLPVTPFGLTADGLNVVNKAKAEGVNIYCVNIMAMDYGQSTADMGLAAIHAAQSVHQQTNMSIGITPMIGINDTPNETFTQEDAGFLFHFAAEMDYVNMLAMWSINRDNNGCPGASNVQATCSGLLQTAFVFVNTLKLFTGRPCNTLNLVTLISVNNGPSFNTKTVSVNTGGSVVITPSLIGSDQSGFWKWIGPNGFSSTARDLTFSNIQGNRSGDYTLTYTSRLDCSASITINISVSGGCTPTPITPFIGINGDGLQNTSSTSVAAGSSIVLSPQPLTGGSWSWTGPNGFSSTSRELTFNDIQINQGGNYIVTHINAQGCASSRAFTLAVTNACTPTPIVPFISINGASPQNISSASVNVGTSLVISPDPATNGSWRWNGPNGFVASSRQITLGNIQVSEQGNYIATYTNTQGCLSTKTFSITVQNINNGCNGLQVYPTGIGSYVAGTHVSYKGNSYEAKGWPFTNWANTLHPAYEPGLGWAWQDAWIHKGSCAARATQLEETVISTENIMTKTSTENSAEIKLVIRNANGVELVNQYCNHSDDAIDANMPHIPGLYIVTLQHGKKVLSKKYIVK